MTAPAPAPTPVDALIARLAKHCKCASPCGDPCAVCNAAAALAAQAQMIGELEQELDKEVENHQTTIEAWKKESGELTEENDRLSIDITFAGEAARTTITKAEARVAELERTAEAWRRDNMNLTDEACRDGERIRKAEARVAELEGTVADQQWSADELERERAARNAIDPITRLHNLCDGIAEHRRESPYNAESLELADAANVELQQKLKAAESALAAARRVPREPTDEMIEAGMAAMRVFEESDDEHAAMIWRAMQAVAPQTVCPRCQHGVKHKAADDGVPHANEMCDDIYAERTEEVLGLVEALDAINTLCGGHDEQSRAVQKIVADAIKEHAQWTQ